MAKKRKTVVERGEQTPDASSSTPVVSPVAPDTGSAPEEPGAQPPRPVAPGGIALQNGQPIDPQLRASIEAIMSEQKKMAEAPPVEDPPEGLVVRQPREEYSSTGRGTLIPRNEEWMRLPEPYENMLLLMWVDFPKRLARAIDSRQEQEVLQAAKRIILGHNSWEDDEGILPDPGKDEFWERLAPRITVQVIRSIIRVMIKLPNSPKPTQIKPTSG